MSAHVGMRGSPGRSRLFAFERNAVVRAGAGTGKTEALSTVYLHLVGGIASPAVWPRGGVGPERIVALTFTEKAAREMRERITEAVTLLAAERLPRELEATDPEARLEAAKRWGLLRGVTPAVVARVLALADSAAQNGRPLPSPEAWQRIAWSLGSAQVGTFHGFAAGLLRRSAVELGLDPAFGVIEEEDADRMLRAAALAALSDAAQRDVSAVVELMAAGGGIGERGDRGLVTLIADLVRALDEDGLRAEGVTVAAAVEPTDVRSYIAADTLARFAAACGEVPALRDDGTAQRVHDLAHRIEDFPPMTSPERALERVRVLRSQGKTIPPRTRTRKLEPLAEEAREAVSSLLRDALSVVSVRLAEAARSVAADTQRRYERAKKQRAGVDYSDLMRLLRDGLRDRATLRREWKQRYDAVLVDEFQDTNRVQRDLLYLLRERRDAERLLAPGQSLTAAELERTGLLVVGDAKQSIYAFRGAEVAVFLSTEQELADAGGERLELTDSFRALDRVLEAVNPITEALLTGVGVHATGMYDRVRDTLVATAVGDTSARVELALVPEGRADDQRRAEADVIARRITELATSSGHGPGWRAPRMDEIAVLVPSWSHLEPIKRALQIRGIPYTLRGGPGFWDRREVDDLIVLLRFVAQPSDRLSLAALLRGPLVGLSDAGLGNLFAEAAGLDDILDPPTSLRAALDADDRARLDEARASLRRLVRFGPTLGPHGVLRQVLAERGYAAVLARLPFGAQRVANVDKLLSIAAAAEERGGDEADLAGFVLYVDRMRAAAQRESEADLEDAVTGSVNVMSIHAAKGLEWPVVFVAQTSRRRPPRVDRVLLDDRGRLVALPGGVDVPDGFRDMRKRAHAAEEDDARRLLYVALTRARDLLVVTGPAGAGEGEWPALRSALEAEAPFRVRVVAAGEGGATVPVRARAEATDDDVQRTATVEKTEAPPTRRHLALASEALQDFAWCARRFHALHDLGLREHTGASWEHFAGGDLARRALAHASPAALLDDPELALARCCAANGERSTGAVADAARSLLRRFASLPLARALADDDGLVLGRSLSWALRLEESGRALTVTGVADLVLRGEALDRDGVVVARVATLPDRDEAALPGADPELDLLLARIALSKRFAEGGSPVPVRAAIVALGDEGKAAVHFVQPVSDEVVCARALDAARQLDAARESGRWQALPRYACDGLRCGFVPRCHG
ncbi:MAG: UvrD-helicase domain-containing protein [Polyangiales bacterium]